MKIAVVFDDGLDKPDGVQQCILTLNEWLVGQGHEVHYIVGETKRTDLQNVYVAARNIPVKFNGNRLTIPLPASKAKLRRLIEEIQPDVLHVHVPYSPFMGAKVIEVAPESTGVVGTFHVLPYGAVARYGTRLLGVWLHSTLKRFNSMYAGTPQAAEFARWSMRIDVGDLPHAIDVQRFKSAAQERPKSGKLVVVFLGRLVQRKGALELVKAVAGLRQEIRDTVQIRIGGRGEQQAEIAKFITENNLESCIQMDGFISEDDKPTYLAAADIAIFPSISGESFGISLIEPMAAGAGVVLGGNNLGYQGVLGTWPEALFDPTDTTAFTDYLTRIISDEPLRNRLHSAQQAAVELYDIATVGARWLELYQAACTAGSNPKAKR